MALVVKIVSLLKLARRIFDTRKVSGRYYLPLSMYGNLKKLELNFM